MNLTDISVGAEVLIKSHYEDAEENGEKGVRFTTTCVEILEQGILTNEISTEDGSPVNFDSEIVVTDVYYISEGKDPVVWENALIRRVKKDGQYYHGIVSAKEGRKFNRRINFRLSIDLPATGTVGIDKRPINMMIKDLSASGFAIVVAPEVEMKMNEEVLADYQDGEEQISLKGAVVRKQTVSETKVVYGCRLRGGGKTLGDYISRKQREYLQKIKGKLPDAEPEKTLEPPKESED